MSLLFGTFWGGKGGNLSCGSLWYAVAGAERVFGVLSWEIKLWIWSQHAAWPYLCHPPWQTSPSLVDGGGQAPNVTLTNPKQGSCGWDPAPCKAGRAPVGLGPPSWARGEPSFAPGGSRRKKKKSLLLALAERFPSLGGGCGDEPLPGIASPELTSFFFFFHQCIWRDISAARRRFRKQSRGVKG